MSFLQMLTFYIIKSSTTHEDQKINTTLLYKREILVTFSGCLIAVSSLIQDHELHLVVLPPYLL